MISGATYKNGIALSSDGAVFITFTAPGANSNPTKGSTVNPNAKKTNSDGVVHVRYV